MSIYLSTATGAILDKYTAANGPRARLLSVLANQMMNPYFKRVAKLAGAVDLVSTGDGRLMRAAVPQMGVDDDAHSLAYVYLSTISLTCRKAWKGCSPFKGHSRR